MMAGKTTTINLISVRAGTRRGSPIKNGKPDKLQKREISHERIR